jgi:hypothetical protein
MLSKVHVHPFPVGDWTSRPTLTGSPPERPGGVGHRVLAGRIDEQVGSGRSCCADHAVRLLPDFRSGTVRLERKGQSCDLVLHAGTARLALTSSHPRASPFPTGAVPRRGLLTPAWRVATRPNPTAHPGLRPPGHSPQPPPARRDPPWHTERPGWERPRKLLSPCGNRCTNRVRPAPPKIGRQ